MYFALACEGVTDFAVIESVLCGFFGKDITDEISHLQPHLDNTSKSQKEFGGWELLLDYLQSERFIKDVKFNDYVIIQIDTDVSAHSNFGVSHYTKENEELPTPILVSMVIEKIISHIHQKNPDFYEKHKEKIIFCICVHSIECWLLAYHKKMKSQKTKNCFRELARILNEKEKSLKNYRRYQEISTPLSDKKILETIRSKDISLNIFLERLSNVPAPQN